MDRRSAVRAIGAAFAVPLLVPWKGRSFPSPSLRTEGGDAGSAPGSFSDDEARMVSALAESILDGCGVSNPPCDLFRAIDQNLVAGYDHQGRERFISGLHRMDRLCTRRYGIGLAGTTRDQRRDVVERLDRQLSRSVASAETAAGGLLVANPADSFFYQMKALTLTSFYAAA